MEGAAEAETRPPRGKQTRFVAPSRSAAQTSIFCPCCLVFAGGSGFKGPPPQAGGLQKDAKLAKRPCGIVQEALATRRPEFICQSRQRLQRLALQVEERKLQEEFSRWREEPPSRPGGALEPPPGTPHTHTGVDVK